MTYYGLSATAPLAESSKVRPHWRARYNRAMKLVRRIHLYAGLFMTPWVFLYGVSACLFNHPELFADQEVRRFGPERLARTALAQPLKAATLAGQVVAALNATGSDAGPRGTYRLVRAEEAEFERDLFASVRGGRLEHTIRLDLESGSGTVRTGPVTERRGGPSAPAAPAGGKGAVSASRKDRPGAVVDTEAVRGVSGGASGARVVTLGPPPLAAVEEALPRLLDGFGLDSSGPLLIRSAPELTFVAERRGQPVRIAYNLRTGAVSERPDDGTGRPLSTRRFLLQLHTAHGYPSKPNARWAWALAVDAMAVSMVGWGITGLLMWWQMKNVRRWGLMVLLLSAAVATAVAFGMHGALTS